MKTAIAYIRVSTQKQGRSGLGLEAQQADIARFAAVEGYDVVETFVEIETGKGADALDRRPQLAAALEMARTTKGTIIVSKLDRLTRDVEFGAGLMKAVQFRVAAMPHADNFQLHLYLALAEQEREMISQRTKAALAAVKARGVTLGSPNGNAKQKDRSSTFAEGLRAIVQPIINLPSRAIAAHLNDNGITTPKGGAWSSVTVLRLVSRLQAAA